MKYLEEMFSGLSETKLAVRVVFGPDIVDKLMKDEFSVSTKETENEKEAWTGLKIQGNQKDFHVREVLWDKM